MKTTGIVFLLFKVSLCLSQSQKLSPGDIAITGFNFRNPDQFSFITFTELLPGTEIKFTDCGWKSDNSFREGEELITYTAPPEGVPAFKVITYNSDPGFSTSDDADSFFGFSIEGDQILVFQGEFSDPIFLFALNNNGSSWQTDATDSHSSSLPPGLVPGFTAVSLTESENQMYNCILETTDKNLILNAVSDPQNWTGTSSRFDLPGSCFKDVLPVLIHKFYIRENTFPLICYEISCDNPFNIEIEWSENGKNFFPLLFESYPQGQHIKSCYEDMQHTEGYYRIHMEESGIHTYSNILNYSKTKKNPLTVQLISTNGILLAECSTLEESERLIKKLSPEKIIIRKTVYADNVKVEKLFREIVD